LQKERTWAREYTTTQYRDTTGERSTVARLSKGNRTRSGRHDDRFARKPCVAMRWEFRDYYLERNWKGKVDLQSEAKPHIVAEMTAAEEGLQEMEPYIPKITKQEDYTGKRNPYLRNRAK